MNSTNALATLRRRVQDVAEEAFTDAIVEELWLIGVNKMLAFIHDINPAALVDRTTFPTVAGTDLYTKQASSLRTFAVEMQNSSGTYDELQIQSFEQVLAKAGDAFEDGGVVIADLGNQWLFAPTPNVVRTVRVWHIPSITTTTLWDNYATKIPLALHTLPIDLAVVELLGETAENIDPVRRRISDALDMIPMLYGRSAKQVTPISMSPFSSSGA